MRDALTHPGRPFWFLLVLLLIGGWGVWGSPGRRLIHRGNRTYAYRLYTKSNDTELGSTAMPFDVLSLSSETADVSIWTADMNQMVVRQLRSSAVAHPSEATGWSHCLSETATDPALRDGTGCLKAFLRVSHTADCQSVHPLCCILYWVTEEQPAGLLLPSVDPTTVFWSGRPVGGFFTNFSRSLLASVRCDRGVVNETMRLAVDATGEWRFVSPTTYYALREDAVLLPGETPSREAVLGRDPQSRLPSTSVPHVSVPLLALVAGLPLFLLVVGLVGAYVMDARPRYVALHRRWIDSWAGNAGEDNVIMPRREVVARRVDPSSEMGKSVVYTGPVEVFLPATVGDENPLLQRRRRPR